MIIRHVTTRAIATKSKLPDADFVINPYTGCTHGCVYCYAEFMCRFTGHAGEKWGTFMDVKEGGRMPGPRVLKGKTILIGSVTDPYNHLEKKYQKTRSILTRLEELDAQVEILTKSPLVLRDMDILGRLKNLRVGLSFSTMDADLARLIEPRAASPGDRLETLKQLNAAGIAAYAFVSPLFPLLSDYRKIAEAVEKYAAYICFENLNLRGSYKKAVLELIKKNYPEQYHDFAAVYQSKDEFNTYWRKKEKEIRAYMKGKCYRIYFFHSDIKKR
ncbi:MAG: radical SAM protein [Treponema sp.]|jgi:DNA repair photolyase|nr:radical SAM protein [Treponema sp.]